MDRKAARMAFKVGDSGLEPTQAVMEMPWIYVIKLVEQMPNMVEHMWVCLKVVYP